MKEFSEKYTSSGKLGNMLVDNYFRSVEKLLGKVPAQVLNNSNVLEVGCGPGFSSEKIVSMLDRSTKFFISDYEKENVDDARKKLGDRANVSLENIYSLDREDKGISLIFVLEVLQHLEKPEEALEEVKRVGSHYFILGVPREPVWRILNMLRGKYLKDFGNTPGHLQHWSKKRFKKFLEDNSFQIVATESPLPWTLILAEKINRES